MSSYVIYKNLGDYLSKLVKQRVPGGKKMTDNERIAFVIRNYSEPMSNTPHVLAHEYMQSKTGNQTIFPESSSVLDNLLNAKFDILSIDGFSTPYDIFSMAIPNGYMVDGVIMPPLLVGWINATEYENTYIKPYCKDVFKADFNEDNQYNSDKMLIICYPDPYNPGVSGRFTYYASELPLVLRSNSPGEFKKSIESIFIDDRPNMERMEETDFKIQYYALKLITALSVYNMATHGEKLREGYPGTEFPSIIGKFDKKNMRMLTLKDTPKNDKSNDQDVSAHYRSWFFRQLKAERYYKGEYKDLAPGSRYAFVNETTVNRKVTPYTQEFGM